MTTTPHPLADLMRESSKADHEDAENSSFIADLMSGGLSLDHYCALLAQYAHLYTALESSAAILRSQQRFTQLLDPRLDRSALILADLDLLGGTPAEQSPAIVKYVSRIHQVTAEAPHRYLAHHYVRYLGDLSGGQILARKMQQNYGAGAAALSAWDFSALGKLKPYKDQYRESLNQLRLNPQHTAELLDEVRLAFGFNKALFHELAEGTVSTPESTAKRAAPVLAEVDVA